MSQDYPLPRNVIDEEIIIWTKEDGPKSHGAY